MSAEATPSGPFFSRFRVNAAKSDSIFYHWCAEHVNDKSNKLRRLGHSLLLHQHSSPKFDGFYNISKEEIHANQLDALIREKWNLVPNLL